MSELLTWEALVAEAQEYRASDILASQNAIYFKRGSESLVLRHRVSEDNYVQLITEATPPPSKMVDADYTYDGIAGASDYSWVYGTQRFRVNKFRTSGGPSLAVRPLSSHIPTLEQLGFTNHIMRLLDTKRQGLIIVTGPTGSGKSTTLAGMIDYLNSKFQLNIISIEDPIEYLYQPKRSLIQQREVGAHVASFSMAVRSAMRESPDVILVGEIRDYTTLKACLQAAETGHLVFATLHTKGVASTLMRMLDMAPAGERAEISAMLAMAYQMVIFQKLIYYNNKYITIREILMPHNGVRNCIKTGVLSEVNNTIQMSRDIGMMSWSNDIKEKLSQRLINAEIAANLEGQV